MNDLRLKIYNFFENPKSRPALITRLVIIVLIITSVLIAIAQLINPEILSAYVVQIRIFEILVLIIFTIEFLLRLFAHKSLREFAKSPSNWIDLLAIAPFYFGINNAVILRVFRALRLLRLINSVNLIKSAEVFDLKNSVLRVITPLMLFLVAVKGFVWFLEVNGFWFTVTGFETLFTIIGFALGVVLSQKIGTTYGKFLNIQDRVFTLHGKLAALQDNLNLMGEGSGTEIVREYLKDFLKVYRSGSKKSVRKLRQANKEFHGKAQLLGNTEFIPFHRMAAMMSAMFEEAIYIMTKRTALTPKTYDLLLQQTVMLYSLLLAAFIPGAQGMISILFAGYLLFGLYYITRDLDNVVGNLDGDDTSANLIVLDIGRLDNYLEELEGESRT